MSAIGIIGGSGLDELHLFELRERHVRSTIYGAPSGPIVSGKYGELDVLFLPRHGPDHRLAQAIALVVAPHERRQTHLQT